MKVLVKQFDLNMEIKTRGIELAVYSSDGKKHKGDLVVKKNKLIWCKGRTKSKNGIPISWNAFIDYMESK